jgi:hypothetical protein
VVLTGGTRTPSDVLVGSLHLDTLFLGVHGMSERAGSTTPNLVEAAERPIVPADHTTWGIVGISLITDDGSDEGARALLMEQVPS